MCTQFKTKCMACSFSIRDREKGDIFVTFSLKNGHFVAIIMGTSIQADEVKFEENNSAQLFFKKDRQIVYVIDVLNPSYIRNILNKFQH